MMAEEEKKNEEDENFEIDLTEVASSDDDTKEKSEEAKEETQEEVQEEVPEEKEATPKPVIIK